MISVGLDVGGTKILGVAIDEEGNILAERRRATVEHGEDMLVNLAELYRLLIEEASTAISPAGESPAEVAPPVGVGVPGLVDRTGTLVFAPNLRGANGTDVRAGLADELSNLGPVIRVDNDATCATAGESAFGAGRGRTDVLCVALGTGIGGGGLANGRLMHGLLHPEFGHMRIPHDRARDPFDGVCPYHGDCFEGLASGGALRARWGRPPEEIDDEDAWLLEADYIALGLVNVICTLSPQRIVVGGGVMNAPSLLPLVRSRVRELARGYFDALELGEAIDDYIVPPVLGDRAGVLGAIELARLAVSER